MIRSLLARLRIWTKEFANNLGKVRELFLISSRTILVRSLNNFSHIKKKGSSKIWSDKVSPLHIKVTQRGGEHRGESRQYHGGAEGTKSDGDVVYILLIALVINVFN